MKETITLLFIYIFFFLISFFLVRRLIVLRIGPLFWFLTIIGYPAFAWFYFDAWFYFFRWLKKHGNLYDFGHASETFFLVNFLGLLTALIFLSYLFFRRYRIMREATHKKKMDSSGGGIF
jgi:hypothetical protein